MTETQTAFLFGVFSAGPIFIGIISLIFLGFLFAWVEDERFVATFWLFTFWMGLFHLFGVINLAEIFRNPRDILVFIFAYFAIGILWTSIKWNAYVNKWGEKTRKRIELYRKRWEETEGTKYPNGNTRPTWEAYLQQNVQEDEKPPRVSQKIGKLVGWAFWWPLSVAYALFHDLACNIYQFVIIEVIGRSLQKIADRKAKAVYGDYYEHVNK